MKKKIQSVLVDCQHGIGETLRVKPLTWGHGSNFGSPGIWVVTPCVWFNQKEEFYFYMKSYSLADNTKAQNYPNILVIAGLNDPRVWYSESGKCEPC